MHLALFTWLFLLLFAQEGMAFAGEAEVTAGELETTEHSKSTASWQVKMRFCEV